MLSRLYCVLFLPAVCLPQQQRLVRAARPSSSGDVLPSAASATPIARLAARTGAAGVAGLSGAAAEEVGGEPLYTAADVAQVMQHARQHRNRESDRAIQDDLEALLEEASGHTQIGRREMVRRQHVGLVVVADTSMLLVFFVLIALVLVGIIAWRLSPATLSPVLPMPDTTDAADLVDTTDSRPPPQAEKGAMTRHDAAVVVTRNLKAYVKGRKSALKEADDVMHALSQMPGPTSDSDDDTKPMNEF